MVRMGPVALLVFSGCAKTVGSGDGVLQDSEIPQVGWIAEIGGLHHDLAGSAEIVDESTIVIQDFVYDGGGINARFYLLIDGEDFNKDLEISDNLVGTEFNGEELTLDLPPGAMLDDFNLLTFWCVPAAVSFGNGVFQAP